MIMANQSIYESIIKITVDNGWVVPYSPILPKAFKAHINVEYCNSVKSIKYICKFVNKGSDMVVFGVAENRNDEITQYQMGRYISSNEAVWRILSFPIHDRMRISFFELCQNDQFTKTLLYSQVPKYYTWNASGKKWNRRKQGRPVQDYACIFESDAIGRLYTVHPSHAECFYLRLLLIHVRGPTSFLSLKRVNGLQCHNFRQACQELHLLDNHWDATLGNALAAGSPHQIRTLFAIIIATCFLCDPLQSWENFKDFMTQDILHRMRRIAGNNDLMITLEMFNEALIIIEVICLEIANKALTQLGLQAPNRHA
ncbi:uncharacterized protein LOC125775446 [Bactrocera dorsalis]|uniref:Uncharacterized protein LOC125775446 n=1 Tax=Bactrocera dorsalis TaxID=27457 RepID=A0ABM3IYH7_BACDO|nr:uncharacterized protein LOC125775446 [Bactrocera dorsalis]